MGGRNDEFNRIEIVSSQLARSAKKFDVIEAKEDELIVSICKRE